MSRQGAELAVCGGLLALAKNQLRQPLCIESARAGRGRGLLPQIGFGVGEITGGGQVGVDRLTGDEQPHDLTGSFEDAVDPQVPRGLLDRHRALPAGGQGLRGLVAAAAADLQQLIDDLIGHLAGPQFGQRRLDPDVVAAFVGHLTGQFEHRVERVGGGGHEGELAGDRFVLADRLAPLHALTRPFARYLQRPLRRTRSPPRVRTAVRR